MAFETVPAIFTDDQLNLFSAKILERAAEGVGKVEDLVLADDILAGVSGEDPRTVAQILERTSQTGIINQR